MKQQLRLGFRDVILHSINDARNRVPAGPHEPDIIASLVLSGTPGFQNVINNTNNTRGVFNLVNCVGVFCHQSPMVEYNDRGALRRCELGDLLWCHFHTDIYGQLTRNALLFQSKISSVAVPLINYDDTQLKLYREWPEFAYYRPGNLNGHIRNLFPKGPHAGAQYMLIDNGPIYNEHPNYFPIGTTSITPLLLADTPLENELVRFLFFGSGRSFDSYLERDTDVWTKIVWDLLGNGFRRAFNRRRAGFNNTPRISLNYSGMDGMLAYGGGIMHEFSSAFGDEFYSEFKSIFSNESGSGSADNYTASEDEGGSPSIVVFVTNESSEFKSK